MPEAGDRCTVTLDGVALVDLTAGDATVKVAFHGDDWEGPTAGEVRVLLDGPVVELSSAGGLFGLALNTAGRRFGVTGSGSPEVREVAVRALTA
jgi:beta-fructofuranosidase